MTCLETNFAIPLFLPSVAVFTTLRSPRLSGSTAVGPSFHLWGSFFAELLERLEEEFEGFRPLVRQQGLHRYLAVVLVVDDDDQAEGELVPGWRMAHDRPEITTIGQVWCVREHVGRNLNKRQASPSSTTILLRRKRIPTGVNSEDANSTHWFVLNVVSAMMTEWHRTAVAFCTSYAHAMLEIRPFSSALNHMWAPLVLR